MKMFASITAFGRRPSTLADPSGLRMEVPPPSLCYSSGSAWQRLMFWLLAPAPHEASAGPSALPPVRTDFLATIADIDSADADRLRHRIAGTRTLRELWHLRADLFRLVGVAHDQAEAERRLHLLARHFPTRAPRSQFGVLGAAASPAHAPAPRVPVL
jgi:hypothetical protein